MKELKLIAASYGRSALAGALAVYMSGETDPKKLAWGLWAGVVPLLMRYLNPKDLAFGARANER